MLIVDTPFPPYSPREYVYGGVPAVGDLNELWSDEPEIGLGDDEVERKAPETSSWAVWLVNGYQSRTDGKAAYVSKDNNGNIERLTWFKEGSPHRDKDLPAEISFPMMKGKPIQFTFFKKGIYHRIFDYAYIGEYNHNGGNEVVKEFSLYGQTLAEDEFFSVHADAIKYNVPLWVALCKTVFGLDFTGMGKTIEDFSLLSECPAEWVARIIGLLPMNEYYFNTILPLIQYEKNLPSALVSEAN